MRAENGGPLNLSLVSVLLGVVAAALVAYAEAIGCCSAINGVFFLPCSLNLPPQAGCQHVLPPQVLEAKLQGIEPDQCKELCI